MKRFLLFLLMAIFVVNFCSAYDVTYSVKNATLEDNGYLSTTTQSVNGFSTEGYVCLVSGCSIVGQQVPGLTKNTGSSSVILNFPQTQSTYGYAIYFFKEGYIGWEQKDVTYWGTGSNTETVYLSKQRKGLAEIFSTINSSAQPNQVVYLDVLVNSPILDKRATNISLKENATVNVTLDVFNGTNKLSSSSQIVTLNYSASKTIQFSYLFPAVGNYTIKVYSNVIDAKVLNSNISLISTNVTVSDSSGNVDVTAPTLNLPGTIYVNTTNILGTNVNFNVNASDSIDGVVSVLCNKNSGDLFLVGTTTVNCNASDIAGNTAFGSFDVIVTHQVPPQCTVTADCGSTTILNYYCNGTNVYKNVSSPDCLLGSCSFSLSSLFNTSCTYGCTNGQCNTVPTNPVNFSIEIVSPINGTYNSTIIPLNYSINGTATSCWYSLNGLNVMLTQCANTTIYAFNGTNSLTVFVSNGTNVVNSSVEFTVDLSSSNDTTAPIITINSPLSKTYDIKNIRVNVSLNENGSCIYNLNSGANKTFLLSGNYFIADENGLSDGNYLVKVFCTDGSGNTASKTVSFKIDTSSDDDDENSNNKKISGADYVLLNYANDTTSKVILNNKKTEVSPWAFFLVFLLLCVLVLFFIVLVLLMRDRETKKRY